MKWVRKRGENDPRSRKDRSVSSSSPAPLVELVETNRFAIRWNRGISVSIRRYDGRSACRHDGNRPDRPSAPAYSSPPHRSSGVSSRTDIDISESCVSTPSSSKRRSRWG